MIFSESKDGVQKIIPLIKEFLDKELKLELHPDKISIKTISSGVDFLGWVNFTDHRVLRTATKRKMFRNIEDKGGKAETVQSYLGLMGYGNTRKICDKIHDLLFRLHKV